MFIIFSVTDICSSMYNDIIGGSTESSFFSQGLLALILPITPDLWWNTLFVSSMTGLFMILIVLLMFGWSTNRQTQIRKSKSQGPKRNVDRVKNTNQDEIISVQEPTCVEDEEEDNTNALDRKSASSNRTMFDSEKSKPKNRDQGGNESRNNREKAQDLMDILSKVKVFSYLSHDSMKAIIQSMEYIDLPCSGMPVLNDNSRGEPPEIIDGSLYAVIAGEVTCSCDFSKVDAHTSLSRLDFVAGEGDIATSLLSILCGMLREYQKSSQNLEVEFDRISNIDVRIVSSADNTRLIRVPPPCFVAMLKKFPHDVHLITQTILARTQRVTIQTLIKSMGLKPEDIKSYRQEKISKYHDECLRVGTLFTSFENNKKNDIESQDINTATHDAAVAAASLLDANELACIKLIEQCASIVRIPPGNVVIESGIEPSHFYLVLDGRLEVGSIVNPENEKDHQSSRREEQTLSPCESVSSRGKSWSRDFVERNGSNDNKDICPHMHVLYLVHPGDMVGQLSCFIGDVSGVTVRAESNITTPAIVLKIPKNILLSLSSERPATLIACLDFILKGISPVVHLLDWGVEWLHVQTGGVLASKGEQCQCLFVVLNGRLRTGERETNWNTNSSEGEEYGRGMCIGDSLLIAGGEWPNDLRAIRNSELAMVSSAVLGAMVRMFPKAGLHFARVIANRVHGKKVIPTYDPSNILPSYGLDCATVAVVPLQPTSVSREELAEFSEVMVENLEKIAPCKLMSKSIARKSLGKKVFYSRSSMYDIKVARMLGDMEENYRLSVYQTDMKYTRWTKTCLQHADIVLIVVRSNEVPKPSEVEQYLSWSHEAFHTNRVHLVILRPADEESISVSNVLNDWSERRPWISGHHLVRIPLKSYEKDVHRMCRRITGSSLGLVLGGGGARGIAHLGVIRALIDAGVSVDMVGGTSQGAFIGALYAKNPDDFDELMTNVKYMADGMSSMKDKLLDLTFPLVSYFNGTRFNRTIANCVGEKTRIQDLILSYFCVSTDLKGSCERVHTKGICWKYVRASMSLQGYLPPVCEGGTLLLDGGYTNMIPGDVMSKQMGARTVIAVDVSAEDIQEYYDYGSNLSGFWLLYNSWNPFVTTVRVPSMGDLSQSLMWVSANKHLNSIKDNFDLFLIPPVNNYGTLEFDKFDEIYEKSYEYAKPLIEKFLKENPRLAS